MKQKRSPVTLCGLNLDRKMSVVWNSSCKFRPPPNPLHTANKNEYHSVPQTLRIKVDLKVNKHIYNVAYHSPDYVIKCNYHTNFLHWPQNFPSTLFNFSSVKYS